MTPDELRKLADEATSGPWFQMNGWGEKVVVRTTGLDVKPIPDSPADARLIALVPDLARLCTGMAAGLQRCADESDYCYACDNHPSHGHAEDCPLAKFAELEIK